RNCRIALALFATGMAASVLIIASYGRPFNSTISPQLLLEIKAQFESNHSFDVTFDPYRTLSSTQPAPSAPTYSAAIGVPGLCRPAHARPRSHRTPSPAPVN